MHVYVCMFVCMYGKTLEVNVNGFVASHLTVANCAVLPILYANDREALILKVYNRNPFSEYLYISIYIYEFTRTVP